MVENSEPTLNSEQIAEIVRGLDPVDWVQMRLLANLTPDKRILAGMSAQSFAMAALRGSFQQRYPELSLEAWCAQRRISSSES
jgi:hypothetical protein